MPNIASPKTFLESVESRMASRMASPMAGQVAKQAAYSPKPNPSPTLNPSPAQPKKKVLVGMKDGQAVYEDEDETVVSSERKSFGSKYGAPPR